MLKRVVLALLFAFPFIVSAQTPAKFGHADFEAIVALMPEKIAADKKYQETAKAYQDDLNRLQNELNKKFQSYQIQRDSLPEEIRVRREQEIDDVSSRAQKFKAEAADQLQQKQIELMKPIIEKLQSAVKEVGDEGGYTYILDSSVAKNVGLILYVGKNSEDLTDKVKTKLNLQ